MLYKEQYLGGISAVHVINKSVCVCGYISEAPPAGREKNGCGQRSKEMPEEYTTVLQIAKACNDWPLVTLLNNVGKGCWHEAMQNIFERACENRDDKAAKRYFGMWMASIDDVQLDPFAKPLENREGAYVLEGDGKAIVGAIATAASGRARWAIEAWRGLSDRNHPTLPETTEAIFTEIANRWRNTLEEAEADILFDFLTDLPRHRSGEQRILVGVLRKTTDLSFPNERLTRHFVRYYGRPNRTSDITSILGIGRTRNALDIGNEIALVRHLEGCSDPAFRLAERFAEQIGAVDRSVLALRRTVQSERERRGDCEKDGILDGNVWFDYQDISAVTISIHQRRYQNTAPDSGNRQFELARARVKSWKEQHPDISVHLTLIIQGSITEGVVFTREEKL
jgi:hypothetical protein